MLMRTLVPLALILAASPVIAQEAVQVEIFWTLPTPAESITDTPDGPSNSLLDVSPTGLALTGAPFGAFNRLAKLGRATPTFTDLSVPEASFYVVDEATDGAALLAGEVEQFHLQELFMLKSQSSDTIVTKVNKDGTPLWRSNFGGPDRQVGTAIAALSSGGAVVLGSDNWAMPVWGLSSEGSVVWELEFDRRGGDVAALPDDQVAILGARTRGDARDFREDGVLWIVDASGKVLHQTVVHEDINSSIGSFYETFLVASNGNSIATLSGVTERFMRDAEKAPLRLQKFDLAAQLVWDTEIEQQDCKTEPFVLPTGDVLHGCALPYVEGMPRRFKLNKYGSSDGVLSSVVALLPECQHTAASVAIRIVETSDEGLVIVGGRPPFNVGESCTWAGRMALP